jgi:hypothetical protein
MVATPKEKNIAKQIAKERDQIRSNLFAGADRANPYFGINQFEPESYLPTQSANPELQNVLPSGRYFDPRYPTPVSLQRSEQVEQFYDDPRKYVQDNIQGLTEEQSLLDRGKTLLGRLFDYRDEADLEMFGVNLSAVESVWDGFLKHFIGGFDLLNIGMGGLISALPGGVQTLSYDELSGGKSVGQVLGGEMDPGEAPSIGQIIVTSVALEAKRIREGNARLSDVLLLNPATAPFILAALAADDSALQQEGFDITNDAQREQAFSQGWEKWMSGITDAGFMFADPLIGVGVAIKVARIGAIGAYVGPKQGRAIVGASSNAVDEVINAVPFNTNPLEEIDFVVQQGAGRVEAGPSGAIKYIQETGEVPVVPEGKLTPTLIPKDVPIPDYQNPLARIYHRILQVDETGKRVMSADEIAQMRELRNNSLGSEFASMLHEADNIAVVDLLFQTFYGAENAFQKLARVSPGLADQAFRYKRMQAEAMAAYLQPDALATTRGSLEDGITNLRDSLDYNNDRISKLQAGKTQADETATNATSTATIDLTSDTSRQLDELLNTRAQIEQNLAELGELHRIITTGSTPDLLDPTNPFYNKTFADNVMLDLHAKDDVVTRALNSAIKGAGTTSRITFPTKSNALARTVSRSRERRSTAAYQYGVEGTSILPRKKNVRVDDTTVYARSDGWLSPSIFDGVSRLQRNARVWRWVGQETPSGYIGLRGLSTVGSEREFTAALNLELYASKNGVQVTRKRFDDEGRPIIDANTGLQATETFNVGGVTRREELFQEFYAALNDPKIDAMKVLEIIEAKVVDDLALAYGQTSESMQLVLQKANKSRIENLKLMKNEGYFIDPVDGTKHYAPYLDSQLANGTYMQNFQEFENILKRHTMTEGGAARLRRAMATPADLAVSGLELFNNFWRPLTLMRLSYTTRNVFENMVRAMAFSSSLAPLSWPVRVIANSPRNAVVKRVVSRRAKKAEKRIADSDLGPVMRELNEAEAEYMGLMLAPELTLADDIEPTIYRFVKTPGDDAGFEKMSASVFEERLTAAKDRLDSARSLLDESTAKFDKAVEGTAFGAWRKKNIEALEKRMHEHEASAALMNELLDAPDARGNKIDMLDNDGLIESLAELQAVAIVDAQKLVRLRSNPTEALMEYRSIAGRAKRIGSGSSVGPGGLMYNDAFSGPLEGIVRQLLSADGTNKQMMAVQSNTAYSLWRRLSITSNQPVAFEPGTRRQWVDGMIDVIERDSSSAAVRRLIKDDFDVEKTVQWMISTDEGREFFSKLRFLLGDDGSFIARLDDSVQGAAKARYVTTPSGARLLADFGTDIPSATGRAPLTAVDREMARAYIADVATKTQQQMQYSPGFLALLRRRVQEKELGKGTAITPKERTKGITADDVEGVLSRMSEDELARVGYIQGSEIIDMGTDSFLGAWASLTGKMMRLLGTIPEDAIARSPFYNMRFKAARNQLAELYLEQTGKAGLLSSKKGRTVLGKRDDMAIQHAEMVIPAKDLNRIYYQAHRQALSDTREFMYTIERRTNLGKYGEWIFPFISASQNAVTTYGKLINKEPWLAPFLIDLWRAPQKLGIEDENGNLQIPMPLPWVRDFLKNNPGIPVLGGVLDSNDMIKIPKNGLNVAFPETGFGIFQRPTPIVQVGASELMKANLMPIETPPILLNAMGEEAGNDFWNVFKDYMFGEEAGVSSKFLSYDKITPAYIQRVMQSKDELSAQYGYQYALHWHTQTARFRTGDRDEPPTEDEINQRTTNTFLFYALGNLGIPTPLTPYPILTRPQIESPAVVLKETYDLYRQADPLNANLNFSNHFGDWALQMANTSVTKNIGGAEPTVEATQDIRDFDDLIRRSSQLVGDELSVLGIITNNRQSQVDYDQNAYQMQRGMTIPGRTDKFRESLSPDQARLERQRVEGWTMYRQFMDQLDARLSSQGLTSYQQTAAAPLKQAREQFIFNMMQNPEMQGWAIDWTERGGSRTISAVRVIEEAIADDKFRQKMIASNKEQLVGIMDQYAYYRRSLVQLLRESGKGIDHPDNILLKTAWANMRQSWKARDVRWAEISDLYLSGDDNPENPGNFTGAPLPLPATIEARQ